MTSEDRRKLLHIATGALAFLFRFLSAGSAALLVAALVVHNLFLLPRYAPAIVRGRAGVPDAGLATYPIGLLAVVLLFHQRLEWAAAAWGILAFGDGAAGLVGPRRSRPALPWNRAKSWAGSAAFVVAGTAGGAALLAFVGAGSGRAPDPLSVVAWAGAAAVLAAFAESLPARLDDNVRVLAAATAVFALGAWPAADGGLAARVLVSLAVSVALGGVARAARTVDRSGFAAGVVLATAIGTGGGAGAYAVFVAFFVLASAATRWGRGAKERRGLAQARQGQRGAVHALANVGVAAVLALAAGIAGPRHPGYLLGCSAALATAAFDTVATEVGKVCGQRPRLLTSRRAVPAGTPGAVSWEGTAAGLAAAAAVAVVGGMVGLYPLADAWIVAAAAALGSTLESLAGAMRSVRRALNAHARNLLNTVAGAGAALALARLAGG